MIYANFFDPAIFSGALINQAATNGMRKNWQPAVDLTATDHAYLLRADLPGVRFEDIDLSVEKGVLTLAGERRAPEDDGERTRAERRFGTFERSFMLPENADTDAIDAKYEQGVLTVTIPKKAEAQPRKIEVKH